MPAIMCIWQAPRQVRNTGQQHNLLIVPTLQRGNGILTFPRHQVQKNRATGRCHPRPRPSNHLHPAVLCRINNLPISPPFSLHCLLRFAVS